MTAPDAPISTTVTARVRAAVAAHRAGDELPDAGVALFLVILMALVTATLSIIVLAAVVQQTRPTSFGEKNTRTVFAAEAGLQAALSQIRTATGTADSTGLVPGEPTRLPCAMSGDVADAASNLRYSVAIDYFSEDPTTKSDAWRTSHRLDCTAADGVRQTPSFALLTATGSAPAAMGFATAVGDRRLRSLYTFNVIDANIVGGLMFTFGGGYCLQAASSAAGAAVTYVAKADCISGAPLQTWSFATDYSIKLTSTTAGSASGLCLTGSTAGSGADVAVTLTTCVAGQANQLFSYEGGSRFRGQNADNTGYGVNYLWAGAQTTALAGRALVSGKGSSASSDQPWGSFAPEARVGAGAAGYATHQVVNLKEFGRCFDVTSENTSKSYMIVYPCKQDPTALNGGGGRVLWNHKWYYTEPSAGHVTSGPQQISILNASGAKYCLTTPAVGANPANLTLSASCAAGTVTQQFTRTGDTGTYAGSYTFTDTYGRCITAAWPNPNDSSWSTLVAAPCTGGANQKWNAPPNAQASSVTGTQELVRGS